MIIKVFLSQYTHTVVFFCDRLVSQTGAGSGPKPCCWRIKMIYNNLNFRLFITQIYSIINLVMSCQWYHNDRSFSNLESLLILIVWKWPLRNFKMFPFCFICSTPSNLLNNICFVAWQHKIVYVTDPTVQWPITPRSILCWGLNIQ